VVKVLNSGVYFLLMLLLSISNPGLEIAGCQSPKAGHILEMAGKHKLELPSKKKWQVKFYGYNSFHLLTIYTR
jgi:hypothetical protein